MAVAVLTDDRAVTLVERESRADVVAQLERANRALAEAKYLGEVCAVRDAAEALRYVLKEAKMSLEAQNRAAEIRIRAERRAGEMLRGLERGKTGPKLSDTMSDNYSEYRQVMNNADLNERTAHRWQMAAEIPEPTFEQHIEETKEAGKELTSAGVHRLAQRLRQDKERETMMENMLDLSPGDRRYKTIIIDPPWPVQKILRDERPNQDVFDYPTMPVEEIGRLPVHNLADPEGCHVYLWVTHKFLPAGLALFEGWGVRYQCVLTWAKNVGFTPFSWMYSTEHVLFGRIGTLDLLRKGLRLDFEAQVGRHSAKPDVFYERVLQASPEPRLELFARAKREGFDVWGNEV